MARLTDHDQRDAEHALRSEIQLTLARYARRMLAQGKAYITDEIAQAVKEGRDLDGLTIGRAAADKVRAEYFTTAHKPEPAIPSYTAPQLEAAISDLENREKSSEPAFAATIDRLTGGMFQRPDESDEDFLRRTIKANKEFRESKSSE